MGLYPMAWAALLLPLAGVVASFLFENPRRVLQVVAASTGLGLAAAVAVLVWRLTHNGQPYESALTFWTFIPAETSADFHPQLFLLVDGLSAVLLPVVLLVSLCCVLHALASVRSERGLRSIGWQSGLATFAAAGLVLSGSLFTVLLFWGLGGACAVMLTWHWSMRPGTGPAARRLFLADRVGDLALLLATGLTYAKFAPDMLTAVAPPNLDVADPLAFSSLGGEWLRAHQHLVDHAGDRTLVATALLLLLAAALRSGLAPLWMLLADTEEAPLPVTALLQSATFGIGGAYLLVRTLPLFSVAPHLLTVLVVVGALTAVGGAGAALLTRDAIRAVSLGAVGMAGTAVLSVGTGGFASAAMVLMVRAVAVAVLMLAVTNLVLVYRSRSLDDIAGGWRAMPTTSRLLLAGAVAASGLVPLAGFWSLRLALAQAVHNQAYNGAHVSDGVRVLAVVALCAAAVLGAAWPIRLAVLAGRGAVPRRRGFQAERVREVDGRLRRPLLPLVVLLVVGGLVAIPGWRFTLAGYVAIGGPGNASDVALAPILLALVLPVAGAALGTALATGRLRLPAGTTARRLGALLSPAAAGGLAANVTAAPAAFASLVDERVIDGFTRGVAGVHDLASVAAPWWRRGRGQPAVLSGLAMAAVLSGIAALAATGHLWGVHP